MKKDSRKLLPVGFPVYHAISQVNRAFEDCVDGLEQLMGLNLVAPKKLRVYQVAVEEIRALVNQDHAEIINDREQHNGAYYEYLRLKWLGLDHGPKEALKAQVVRKQQPQRVTERKRQRRSGTQKVVKS